MFVGLCDECRFPFLKKERHFFYGDHIEFVIFEKTKKKQKPMEVICLEEEAFYTLIERVVDRIKEKNNIKEDKWIPSDQAMHLLNITSKTTLQKLRDEGRIRFTQPSRKLILYDRDSILAYLDKKAKETF